MIEGARRDLVYALRALRCARGFAAAAIATAAIGIGASTAVFSVAYGVSLRPLPFRDADRLIRIYEAHPGNGKLKEHVSAGAFNDWREGAPSLESIALYSTTRGRYLAGAGSTRVTMMSVSPGFFELLGVRPLLGPGFKAERDYTPRTASEVVLSHGAWQRLLGGRPDVIGESIELEGAGDNDAFRIVGVMPPDFAFTEPVDAWSPEIVALPVPRGLRNWRYDRVLARLRPGASLAEARAELEAVAAHQRREFPAIYAGWTVTVESLHDSIVGPFGRATWLLLAAMALVLLVTCFNVGGLLIARAVGRERETAVRAALGAGRSRLAGLWLAEASLIGLTGAALGLLLAWSAVRALRSAAPVGIPRVDSIAIDGAALAVTCLATLGAIALFTLAPLRVAPYRDLAARLRAASAAAGERPGRQAARAVLTLAQCAGAACLVVLALLLTRSFLKLTAVDLGWNPRGVLSESLSPRIPREVRRPWFRYVEWSDRLIARLEGVPGIQRAAITTRVPLSPATSVENVARGRQASADEPRWPAVMHMVSDGYFEVMGIRMLEGRVFGAQDRFTEAQLVGAAAKESGTAIVTESTARTLWPGRSPIGEILRMRNIDVVEWRQVVGVVPDLQFNTVGESPVLHVFLPWTQMPSMRPTLLVKSSMQAPALITTVRDVVEAVDPGTRLDNVAMLQSLVERATAQPRFTTTVVAGFGVTALLVAAVGIYGTLSYLVAARTREIGIRLALGAPRRTITAMVLTRGVLPAAAGCAVGVAIAVLLARAFRAMLFEIVPVDAPSLAGGAVLLLAVAVVAAVLPARRAARVDPIVALRAE